MSFLKKKGPCHLRLNGASSSRRQPALHLMRPGPVGAIMRCKAVWRLLLLLAVVGGGGAGSTAKQKVRILAFIGVRHKYDLPNAIAAQVAVERVNEDALILPNVTLELDVLDSTLIRTMEQKYEGISEVNMASIKVDLLSALLTNSLHFLCVHDDGGRNGGVSATSAVCNRTGGIAAVIGPLYSSEAALLSTVLKPYGLLAMSYGATLPSLSNSTLFPDFARTIPPDSFQGEAIAGLVAHLGITAVQVWSCSDVYCRGLASVFRDCIRPLKVGVEEQLTKQIDLNSIETAKAVMSQVLQNCSAPRIMVLMVQRSHAETLFRAAEELGVTQEVIWIGPSSVTGLDRSLPRGYLGVCVCLCVCVCVCACV
jgi:hypothetical protein